MERHTRPPLKAPFSVGTKLRYIGDRKVSSLIDGKYVPILFNGMETKIISISPGWQGTGMIIDVNDETGEDIIDCTHDDTSVYETVNGEKRLIHNENKKEWQVIE
ncbi:MAG: hypothetical protein AABY32_00905 [Nanoarchaeota archaeon]